MGFKEVLFFLSVIILICLLVVYFFIPLNTIELSSLRNSNSNFTLNESYENMQFYNNMRFPSTNISYRISECSLDKRSNMEEAFLILENLTILDFYPVPEKEEILVNCDDRVKFDGDFFIAGEGGPTNITVAGEYNIITSGRILLLRESQCSKPNIAIHELLHVLGFDHSQNPDNIMYEISKCNQEIGEDTINFINTIYSIPSRPDLVIDDVSGFMSGKYLNTNLTIRNQGIVDSLGGKVVIYADDKEIKQIPFDSLEVGYGTRLSLSNIWINKISINEIKFFIETDFEEINKLNNEAILYFEK